MIGDGHVGIPILLPGFWVLFIHDLVKFLEKKYAQDHVHSMSRKGAVVQHGGFWLNNLTWV
jgi:hypothetical protein